MSQLNDEEWYRERFGTAEVWLIVPCAGAGSWSEFQELGIVAIGWPARGNVSGLLKVSRFLGSGKILTFGWFDGWPDLGDLRLYRSEDDIQNALNKKGAGEHPLHDVHVLWEFPHEMKKGDVLVAKKGRTTVLGWGVVTGDYTYDPEREEYQYIRSVKWHPCITPVQVKDLVTTKTLTRFSRDKERLRSIFRSIDDDDGSHASGERP